MSAGAFDRDRAYDSVNALLGDEELMDSLLEAISDEDMILLEGVLRRTKMFLLEAEIMEHREELAKLGIQP